ncbi:MAG: hypothetical protein UV64_C0007G0045 [Parcubacteria group bacterium GW2011_GWC1_43_11b]|nr:MAG: hypothetical protein UV64_C0007G0045 [Parcubacteria group bacterium GW2011_GWC1_43_11b]
MSNLSERIVEYIQNLDGEVAREIDVANKFGTSKQYVHLLVIKNKLGDKLVKYSLSPPVLCSSCNAKISPGRNLCSVCNKKSKLVNFTCPVCGRDFQRKKSSVNYLAKKFPDRKFLCSKKCNGSYQGSRYGFRKSEKTSENT